jgi:hypothetical protein
MKKEELKKERAIKKVLWGRAVIVAMLLSLTMVTMSESVYARTPVEERYYGKCLLKQELANMGKRSGTFDKEIIQRGVLCYREYLEEHTILLRGLIRGATYDINITFQDVSGNKVMEELKEVVPADVLNVKTDDRRPPKISEVKVGPIVKGIFLETSITWKTDEPATSCVEYGRPGRYGGQRSSGNSALVKQHSAKIYELQRGRDYHFRVKSEDVFGNEAVSEDLVFNTEKICVPSVVKERAGGKSDGRGLAVRKAEIFMLDSDLGLYLQVTEPAIVSVEFLKVKDPLPTIEPQLQAGGTNGCISCHQRH